ADEEEGRLEVVLSTPQPRSQVLLGRFAALTTGDDNHWSTDLSHHDVGLGSRRLKARRGQSDRSNAQHHSTGTTDGRHRLSILRLAEHSHRDRPLEFLACDLVRYQLCWCGFELAECNVAGCNLAHLRLLLLWHTAAARLAPAGYAW